MSVSLTRRALAAVTLIPFIRSQAMAQQASTSSTQVVRRAGSQPSQKGPAETFTGNVRIDPLFPAQDGSSVSGALVTFEPGARSAWHSHPMGQNLVILSGVGWTQCEGGPKTEIRAGDVVSCPCQRRHWHGATTTTAMSHIAIQEAKDGTPVTWMEQVTDAEYLAPVASD
jgi:quercetin dioxygenase-like cupin family protein